MTNKEDHEYFGKHSESNRAKYSDGFYKLQEKLHEMRWFCGWAVGPDQREGWTDIGELQMDDPTIEDSKILFNHEQCIEVEDPIYSGNFSDEIIDKWESFLSFEVNYDYQDSKVDEFLKEFGLENPWRGREWGSVPYYNPDEVPGSTFYFGDAQELEKILPVIEECGCTWKWDKTQETAIEIFWN